MKKIDLHIHTIPSYCDSQFTFSLNTFKRYVSDARLDAVAVTNHDLFDAAQFRTIQGALGITVFPGIEINVEKGHVLILTTPTDVDDFEERASHIMKRIRKRGDTISIEDLKSIYKDLDRYLIIPHYEKDPPLSVDALNLLGPHISSGEVDSPKKFIRAIRNPAQLTPVLFSDARMSDALAALPTRQTFVDCGALSISALKHCLKDKSKVALSESDGNRLWQVFEDGQKLSTGLNVVLGARSSGKTHTLDKINEEVESCKYIKQFQLVQQDDAANERAFNSNIEKRRSAIVDHYLMGFKRVLEEIVPIRLDSNDREVGAYIDSLLKSATDADRRDAFSKASLFNAVEYPIGNTDTLHSLIDSVKQVIENIEFRPIIERHLELSALKKLAAELIELLWRTTLENRKLKFVNDLVRDVKQGLKFKTSATQLKDVDLYRVAMDERRVQRFAEIVGFLKRKGTVHTEDVQGFRIEAKKEPLAGPGEVKAISGLKVAFSEAFRKYSDPYGYLQELLSIESLPRADLFKLFAKISYQILNKDGFQVSGGERSEFRLLQEIADSQNYDILLIDEPESSFDNLFLRSNVNEILKSISGTMPVVVVTHNSTVGASIHADYVLHTSKDFVDGKPEYRIYSGYPTDKTLTTVDGESVQSHQILMDSLEAGSIAYDDRRSMYETIKG